MQVDFNQNIRQYTKVLSKMNNKIKLKKTQNNMADINIHFKG